MEVYMLLRRQAKVRPPGIPFFSGKTSRPPEPRQPAIEPVNMKTPRGARPAMMFSSWPDSPVLAFQRLPTSHQESQGGEQLPRSSSQASWVTSEVLPLAQRKNGIDHRGINISISVTRISVSRMSIR